VNTVINAFHYHTWMLMAQMQDAIGRKDDTLKFSERSEYFREVFNATFLDPKTGIYVDGEKVPHSSLHANLFPLVFGLVPDSNKPKVIAFIKSRGMACSVYPAQCLLEALFENGEADYAIALMASDSERSWRHMLDFGSTITTEAWDIKFKPNMDWNHAWGSAPANIIPRYVLGVRPTSPGFATAVIAPQIGKLERVSGIVPTIHGPIAVRIDDGVLKVQVPIGLRAQVNWPGEWEEVPPGHIDF
jgi:alpha-L-rhamnosidase